MSHIVFTIKTNSYAGNFEREMAAYITGQPWKYDFEYAETEQALAVEELDTDVFEWFEDHVEYVLSENDDQMGAVSCESRGNDVELYFTYTPPKEIMEVIKHRAYKWAEYFTSRTPPKFKVIGFGLKLVTQTEQELPL